MIDRNYVSPIDLVIAKENYERDKTPEARRKYREIRRRWEEQERQREPVWLRYWWIIPLLAALGKIINLY